MAIILPILTVLWASFMYYRANLLLTLYYNAPARLESINRIGNFEIRFTDLIRNCEDIYLDEKDGFALLSCDPGRDEWNTVMGTFVNSVSPPETGIYIYKYAEDGASPQQLTFSPPKDAPFHPLGIEYHPESQTLFVINHAPPQSTIESYHVDIQSNTAEFQKVIHDAQLLNTPNSIAAVSNTELFVTNDHYFRAVANPLLAKIESYAGIPGGGVAWVKYDRDQVRSESLLHLPFANGIALLNATTLAVSSSTTASVRLYSIDRSEDVPKLSSLTSFTVPFLPDNLSVDGNGKLLVAGHPHAPSLEIVARNNGACLKGGQESEEVCKAHRLSRFAEWTEEDGVKTLYSGSEFGSSTTAVRDVTRGVGFVTGLYQRGLLVWKE
ncbi:uncharacterized protein RCC_04540 [Ramularia collo-cygni]|uniref:Paraoxonase n=1 Tax=Ramularia collo-cygni TaxID=112498 RepID=A0A2D3V575_9PEZI|nr:uncharacterized protein RCC_04540 [Ramularia collo-cygni]CZT18696.1 uncharacterized protein RCC_04540 [Ramularia collo-cygni]